MKTIPDDIYNKIKQISHDVKEDLKRSGIMVPVKNRDGSITVGRFRIVKDNRGFFNIVDHWDEIIVDSINLPQTAALLANKLALGKFIDDQILGADRKYGHALFEETLQESLARKSIKKNDIDKADLMFTKAKLSRLKKEHYKTEITQGFEKLIRFR